MHDPPTGPRRRCAEIYRSGPRLSPSTKSAAVLTKCASTTGRSDSLPTATRARFRLFPACHTDYDSTGMPDRPSLGTPKCALLLVFLLLAATSLTLLHWHKTWADQGCQLCHFRHLPGLNIAIAVAYGNPTILKPDWHSDDSGEESKTCLRNTVGRSPPVSIFF
jgi:hypothetical protein